MDEILIRDISEIGLSNTEAILIIRIFECNSELYDLLEIIRSGVYEPIL